MVKQFSQINSQENILVFDFTITLLILIILVYDELVFFVKLQK